MLPAAPATALLTYGDAPGAHVQLHVLLTGVQTNGLAVAAGLGELLAVGLYLFGVSRLARRGRRWSRRATASFVAGVAAVWVAVGSGLAAYDEVNVQMHVVQHILLMMVAPPLLALGKPVTLASQALPRRAQVGLLRAVHSRVLAAATFPVLTWFLYYGSMYVYFGDRSVYHYSTVHPLFHDATHLIFLTVGLLYWQPLLGSDPSRWRLPYPARVLIVFIGMPFEAFLGISLDMSNRPIDPINTLANTRAAGQTFWILAMAATAAALAVIARQWYRQLDRQTPREDRLAETQAVESAERAARLGVTPNREGWTVPEWRLAQIERQRLVTQRRAGPPDS